MGTRPCPGFWGLVAPSGKTSCRHLPATGFHEMGRRGVRREGVGRPFAQSLRGRREIFLGLSGALAHPCPTCPVDEEDLEGWVLASVP